MNPCVRSLAALALLPLAVPSAEIAFRPEEGGRWRKSFVFEQEMELDRFRVVMNGQEVPGDFLPQMEMNLRSEGTTILADRYGPLAEGRPVELERRYEKIDVRHSIDFQMEGAGADSEEHQGTVDGASALEGSTVAFTWDDEHDRYDARASGDELEASLLDGLIEETDLRSWLPGDDARVGTRWKISSEQLDRLLEPGGDLGVELSGEGTEYWEHDWRERRSDGEIELVLESIDETQGGGHARMTIEGEVRVVGVMEGDLSRVPVVQGEATQTDTTTHRLRGELVWDLATGMPERLSIEASVTLESRTTKDGGDPEYEHAFEFSGNWKLEMECARAE